MRDSTESAQPVGHARPDRPGSACDQRRELINASFAALEITAPVESAFRADLTTVELDDVHLFDMTTNAHRVVRTAEMVEQDAGEYLKRSLQLEGEAQLRQDGRECVLSPGSLGLYVAYRPYELVYEGPQRSMIMTFPRSVVQLIPAQLDLVTARRIGQEDGLGRVAVPEQAGDLLGQQATAYIAGHLADPELSPGSVARALYVSVRQLHSRFAAQGLTVASHIRAARLTAVRAALADPAHRQEAVHTLSARCGLTDPAHVSKIFKAEFGETPSAYRRRVLASS